MTTRFKNAIDALVKSFFKGTLAKGSCNACAVGNICAAAAGVEIVTTNWALFEAFKDGTPFPLHLWSDAFLTGAGGKQTIYPEEEITEKGKELIQDTGYSILELAEVEKAFEQNTEINFTSYCLASKDDIMQDQYNGLMAVVDVLCEIEGIEDPTEYKELFSFA